MTDIFVYYRVAPGARDAALRAARQVLEAVRRGTGVLGGLSCRADDPLTVMEHYPAVRDEAAFLAVLEAACAEAALSTHVDGERHLERFVPCA